MLKAPTLNPLAYIYGCSKIRPKAGRLLCLNSISGQTSVLYLSNLLSNLLFAPKIKLKCRSEELRGGVVSTTVFSFHFSRFPKVEYVSESLSSIYDVIVVLKSFSREGKFPFYGQNNFFPRTLWAKLHCYYSMKYWRNYRHLGCYKESFIWSEYAQMY